MQSGFLNHHSFMKQCLHRIYFSQRFYAGANYSKMDNLYTRLELTATATQADIKKAYYELSKKHHPDRNDGSTIKFRSITEAYEILGNVSTRKDYDRQTPYGRIIHRRPNKTTNIYQSSAQYHEKDDDFTEKIRNAEFYRVKRKTCEFSHVNGKVFDFDAWHRAHFHDEFGSPIHKRRSISWNKSSHWTRSSEPSFAEKSRHSTGGFARNSAGRSTQESSSNVKQNRTNEIAEKAFLVAVASIGAFTFALKCYENFENKSIYRRKTEINSNKND